MGPATAAYVTVSFRVPGVLRTDKVDDESPPTAPSTPRTRERTAALGDDTINESAKVPDMLATTDIGAMVIVTTPTVLVITPDKVRAR